MKSEIGHLLMNIDPQNMPFYKDLFRKLEWTTLFEQEGVLGVGCESGASVWFSPPIKAHANDYDGPGLNHLGISVGTQADVDTMVAYLKEKNVPALFDTPRHRPEFSGGPDQTYYQVMFESPDRLLFEIVYTGPKG